MPDDNDVPVGLPLRQSFDESSNNFGNKLLSLCKQSSLYIMNGRIEPGHFTCYNLIRNNVSASVVDYVICNSNLYSLFNNMVVKQLSEFSDHCPISFTLQLNYNSMCNNVQDVVYDKIVWENCNVDSLNDALDNSKIHFDKLVNDLLSNTINVTTCIDNMSDIIFDISSRLHGRKFYNNSSKPKKVKKSGWFNGNCKRYKDEFYRCKRLFNSNPTAENKIIFLNARRLYCKTKRSAKYDFYNKEKQTLSLLSKQNPRKFWKYIKKYKKAKSANPIEIEINDFFLSFYECI